MPRGMVLSQTKMLMHMGLIVVYSWSWTKGLILSLLFSIFMFKQSNICFLFTLSSAQEDHFTNAIHHIIGLEMWPQGSGNDQSGDKER